MLYVKGKIVSGRGVATTHIGMFEREIKDIMGERPFPGSLNLVLDRPIRVDFEKVKKFDDGFRMLCPARMNGVDVWVYRWMTTVLHAVEIIAPVKLREHLRLGDGDVVSLQIRKDLLVAIPLLDRLAWAVFWAGRKSWCYTNDQYYFRIRGVSSRLGATQYIPEEKVWSVISKSVKFLVGRTPIVRSVAKRIVGTPEKAAYTFKRVSTAGLERDDLTFQQIRNLLTYTKTSNSHYSAEQFPAGYHTIEFKGATLQGQREPSARINLVPMDFSGKSILDIGSNQGGMLLQIKDKIRWGVGIDFDARMVNTANRIKSAMGVNNLNFYVFDLEKEPLPLIGDFLPEAKVDVCFLLSVCMWIKNWKEVINFAHSVSKSMLFESNGTDQQQAEQLEYLKAKYKSIEHLSSQSDDDPKQKRRKLYFLTEALA